MSEPFDLPSKDDIKDVSMGLEVLLKVERAVMAFVYGLMLVLACANVWNYLIKRRMFKSYPMSMAYLFLIVFSTLGCLYELFMSIHCGVHDCISEILAVNQDI